MELRVFNKMYKIKSIINIMSKINISSTSFIVYMVIYYTRKVVTLPGIIKLAHIAKNFLLRIVCIAFTIK